MAQFEKGQSGNPAGRPKGIADKRTELKSLLEPHAPALVQKVVEKALNGDMQALKICIDRLIPPAKVQNEQESKYMPPVIMVATEKEKELLDKI